MAQWRRRRRRCHCGVAMAPRRWPAMLRRSRDGATAVRKNGGEKSETHTKRSENGRTRIEISKMAGEQIPSQNHENLVKFDEIQKNRNKWRLGIFRRLMSYLLSIGNGLELSISRAIYSETGYQEYEDEDEDKDAEKGRARTQG